MIAPSLPNTSSKPIPIFDINLPHPYSPTFFIPIFWNQKMVKHSLFILWNKFFQYQTSKFFTFPNSHRHTINLLVTVEHNRYFPVPKVLTFKSKIVTFFEFLKMERTGSMYVYSSIPPFVTWMIPSLVFHHWSSPKWVWTLTLCNLNSFFWVFVHQFWMEACLELCSRNACLGLRGW